MTLFLHEINNPDPHDDLTLTAVADASGRIVNSQFAPDEHDLGIRFYLTATGSNSQAQMTFTDSRTINSVTLTAVRRDGGRWGHDHGGGQRQQQQRWRQCELALHGLEDFHHAPYLTSSTISNHDGPCSYSETFAHPSQRRTATQAPTMPILSLTRTRTALQYATQQSFCSDQRRDGH